MKNQFYLGDGLYVSHDGWQYVLKTERELGTHYVCLDPEVLMSFLSYVERVSNVKITVEKVAEVE